MLTFVEFSLQFQQTTRYTPHKLLFHKGDWDAIKGLLLVLKVCKTPTSAFKTCS